MQVLAGYRTYIVATAIGVVAALQYAGLLSADTADTIRNFLIGLGVVTMRSALARVEAVAETTHVETVRAIAHVENAVREK